MRVRWTTDAADDLERICDYIAQGRPEAARRIAQTVVERAREFGIRLAIGADRSHVMRLVLRQATTVGIAGLAGGLTLAWFAGRVIESRLYGVTSRDPWLYTVAALMMMMVVGVASAAPARAATRVNPIDVLRVE